MDESKRLRRDIVCSQARLIKILEELDVLHNKREALLQHQISRLEKINVLSEKIIVAHKKLDKLSVHIMIAGGIILLVLTGLYLYLYFGVC